MRVVSLKALAKKQKVKGYGKMKKAELLKALTSKKTKKTKAVKPKKTSTKKSKAVKPKKTSTKKSKAVKPKKTKKTKKSKTAAKSKKASKKKTKAVKPKKTSTKKSKLTMEEKILREQFCDDWEESKKTITNNKVINPKTKRAVAVGSRTYVKFDKECAEIKDVLKDEPVVKKVEEKSSDVLLCEELKKNMKNLKDGKVLNPKTNRLVNAESRTFKKMVKDCDKVLTEVSSKKSVKKKSVKKKSVKKTKKSLDLDEDFDEELDSDDDADMPDDFINMVLQCVKKTKTEGAPSPEWSDNEEYEDWTPMRGQRRIILTETLLEFIDDFEKETGEEKITEAFDKAVIESLEEFDDMLDDGTIIYQGFLKRLPTDIEHQDITSSTVREQELISKLITFYRKNYEQESNEESDDSSETNDSIILTDLIESLKPEFKDLKRDLGKQLSKESKKIDSVKLKKQLKEEIEKRESKKITPKDNKIDTLLKKVNSDKLSNNEIKKELQKLGLVDDIEYLKQLLLLRFENMV